MRYVTTIKRSFLDNAQRELIIDPNFLKFEDKNHKDDSYTIFEKDQIKAYRYGIKWFRGYKFVFGREYQIFIQNHDNKIIKLTFSSYYGRRVREYNQKYSEIIDQLWSNYFRDIASTFIKKLRNNERFSLGKVEFSQNGLIFTSGVSNKYKIEILWDDLGAKDYQNYFALFSKSDQAKINFCLYYKDDWNTAIVYSIVRTFLNEKI